MHRNWHLELGDFSHTNTGNSKHSWWLGLPDYSELRKVMTLISSHKNHCTYQIKADLKIWIMPTNQAMVENMSVESSFSLKLLNFSVVSDTIDQSSIFKNVIYIYFLDTILFLCSGFLWPSVCAFSSASFSSLSLNCGVPQFYFLSSPHLFFSPTVGRGGLT